MLTALQSHRRPAPTSSVVGDILSDTWMPKESGGSSRTAAPAAAPRHRKGPGGAGQSFKERSRGVSKSEPQPLGWVPAVLSCVSGVSGLSGGRDIGGEDRADRREVNRRTKAKRG